MARKPKTIKESAWKYMSLYTRMRYSHHNGQVKCVTCGTFHHWKEIHAGHFVHASKMSPVSYDERNIHPQCRQCNFYGNKGLGPIAYTRFIQNKYGDDVVDELMRMKHQSLKKSELELIEGDLKAKVKDLEKEVV